MELLSINIPDSSHSGIVERNCRNMPSESGCYLLVIHLRGKLNPPAGKPYWNIFKQGFYFYCGSAGRGIRQRCTRYLNTPVKKPHWHIDYLISAKETSLEYLVSFPGDIMKECSLVRLLTKRIDAETTKKGFGATDCNNSCGSHLLYRKNFDINCLPPVFHSL